MRRTHILTAVLALAAGRLSGAPTAPAADPPAPQLAAATYTR